MKIEECMKIISCQSKRTILKILKEEIILSPTQLAEKMGISAPAISAHLKELSLRKIVEFTQMGNVKKFYIVKETRDDLIKCLKELLDNFI